MINAIRKIGLAAGLMLGASAPALAATVVDDFGIPFEVGFASVQATNDNPVVSATSSNGTILGGERDIRVEVIDNVIYPGDNVFAAGTVTNGYFGPYNQTTMSMGIDQAARVNFRVTYDGIGVGASAAGLGINAAALGSSFRLGYFASLLIDPTAAEQSVAGSFTQEGYGSVDFITTLTDFNGQIASVTSRMPGGIYGAFDAPINFAFSDFEAANNALDLTNINRISFATTVAHYSPASGYLALVGAGFAGAAYTPTNQIGGGGGGGTGAVPEPASWAMLILGFSMIGQSMRRRRKTDAGHGGAFQPG